MCEVPRLSPHGRGKFYHHPGKRSRLKISPLTGSRAGISAPRGKEKFYRYSMPCVLTGHAASYILKLQKKQYSSGASRAGSGAGVKGAHSMELPYEIVDGEIRRPDTYATWIEIENRHDFDLIPNPELEEVRSFDIPDGVTKIGPGVFSYCRGLQSVTIPDSVTVIDDKAFLSCCSLKSITIPSSVTAIGSSAFENCSGLTSAVVPDSVTSMGDRAFSGCRDLADTSGFSIVHNVLYDYYGSSRTAVIPAGVTSIGEEAFAFLKGRYLTSVTIPGSVKIIGKHAFRSCENLKSIILPEGVTVIGEEAFWGCSSLESVTIPGSVTTIGRDAFRECRSLTSITIPRRLESVFKDCKSVRSINFSD